MSKAELVQSEVGKQCWRKSLANRAAVLVDAKDYFESLAWAAERAERSLYFLCWDIDSRISLLPPSAAGSEKSASQPLADYLLHLLEKKPQLEIYILAWDFPALFAHERESKKSTRARFGRHPRMHFRFAPCGPLLISHHQKIAVIDDKLAFCGGLDITQQRWDTHEHRLEHPARKDPDGDPYGPFHDVQMMVEGPAARDLGDLFREAWARHTKLPAPPRIAPGSAGADLWPPELKPLFHNVPVAISRTIPAWRKEEEVRESEELFIESIRRARDYIFVENQYLTSRKLGSLLAERLKEENPPEILLLVRLQDSDWKEGLMGVLRARFVRKLKRADTKKRLLVLCPAASAKKKEWLNLHSKVFISDDSLLRVGSSNLCNRSAGMDYECDLTLLAAEAEQKQAVRSLRNHLLAHHLSVSEAEVESETSESLLAGVRRLLHRSDQTLVECPQAVNRLLDWFSPSSALIDPENPREFAGGVARAFLYVGLLVGAIVAFPHLKNLFRQETVLPMAEWVQSQPYAPVGMIALFTLLASLAFPLVPLALAFALILPPWQTFLCLTAGSMLSAVLTYYVPRWLSSGGVTEESWAARLLASERLGKFRGMLDREGFWPIVLFRLIPIAPFWIENVLMGLLGIKFWHYLLATFLSLLPGFVMISFLEDQLSKQGGILTMIAIFCALFALLGWGIQKGLRHFLPAGEMHANHR